MVEGLEIGKADVVDVVNVEPEESVVVIGMTVAEGPEPGKVEVLDVI